MKESIEVSTGRYLAGEMSEQERIEFQNELASNPAWNEAYLDYVRIWQTKLMPAEGQWDDSAAWQTFRTRNTITTSPIRRINRNVAYWAIAASLIIVLGTAFYFVLSPSSETYLYSDAEHSMIKLKDGSTVHLNKGSGIIVYPFSRKERHAELSGEAFFQISPDAKRPFTIACGKTETEVVGTSFDIKQSPDQVHLFVHTGKVIFKSVDDHPHALALQAGEAAFYDQNDLRMIPNPSPNVNAWHTHQLQFTKTPLVDAVHDISEYFGYPVLIENAGIQSCKINITLPYKNPEIQAILTDIALSVNATVVREGDKFIIKGGNLICN